MQKVIEKFKGSASELARPQSVAVAAMLLALRVVLGYFSNFTLNLTPSIKFSFSFLPLALCGALLGPTVGLIVGGLGDIFSYILNPAGGAYFPGWTLDAALTGLLFGIFLYKCQGSASHRLVMTIAAKVTIAIFVELLLGTFWLHVQFGMPYFVTFASRALKQLVFTPIEIVIIFTLSSALMRAKIFR